MIRTIILTLFLMFTAILPGIMEERTTDYHAVDLSVMLPKMVDGQVAYQKVSVYAIETGVALRWYEGSTHCNWELDKAQIDTLLAILKKWENWVEIAKKNEIEELSKDMDTFHTAIIYNGKYIEENLILTRAMFSSKRYAIALVQHRSSLDYTRWILEEDTIENLTIVLSEWELLHKKFVEKQAKAKELFK